MLLLVPAFLKANYPAVLELLLAAGLLGAATLSLIAGAKFRMRWASLLAFFLSAASGLPILMLSSTSRLHKLVVALSLVALLVGALGARLALGFGSGAPPQERIRRRKRKPRN